MLLFWPNQVGPAGMLAGIGVALVLMGFLLGMFGVPVLGILVVIMGAILVMLAGSLKVINDEPLTTNNEHLEEYDC